MKLRYYQEDAKTGIYKAWDGNKKFILAVLPTGAGKTVLFSEIIKEHKGPSCAIAHRQELVSQISLALAKDGVKHRIIGPKSVVKLVVRLHMAELGKSFYDPSSPCAVAGVDTLIKRRDALKSWADSVTLWVQDEAHHVLRANKWGMAASMFPNSKGLGVTATPIRADGRGLGAHADGVFETMIVGPTMRELIGMNFLTDYRIFAPASDIDFKSISISAATGDYNRDKMKKTVRESKIVGDVVNSYRKFANGKLGVTFATDVETATDIAKKFNSAGVPAEVVSAKTPDHDRISVLRRFKNREILQLVNVDLFGEGFDLPAIEVVSMARPTQSYALYVQQFGRALRILDGKLKAIIIDHVGNVARHKLPDIGRPWSLDSREKKTKTDDAIPVKTCPNCTSVYERIFKKCPFCGFLPAIAERSGPEHVDGDLTELTPDILALMRGEIAMADRSPAEYRAELAAKFAPVLGQMAGAKRQEKRLEAQKALRSSIAWWGGYQRSQNRSDSESYRRFYFKFGMDVLTAQTLQTKDALQLAYSINSHLGELAG